MPEHPSPEEAKDAVMAMRVVVNVKFTMRQHMDNTGLELIRYNVFVDGKLELVGVHQITVPGHAYPVCVDDPHLIVLADRMPLKRLRKL